MRKNSYFWALSVTFLFTVISAFGFSHVVKAQQTTGIIVSPPSLVLQAEGGKKQSKVIYVTNQRTQDETIYVYSKQVGIDELGRYYTPEGFNEGDMSEFEQKGWLTYTPREFFLPKGETKAITVEIDLPDNLETKGYYLELAISTVPKTQTGTVGTAPEVALPISINYTGSGKVDRKLDLILFNTLPKEKVALVDTREGVEQIVKEHESNKLQEKWFDFAPVTFFAYVKNTGNANVTPAGSIFISRDPNFAQNSIITTLEVDREKRIILNNAGRVLLSTWDGGFFSYDNKGNFKVDFSKWSDIRFGKYYAQINLVWDGANGKEFKTETVAFWVFPWQLILVIVFIVGLIATGVIMSRKRKAPTKPKHKK